MADARPVFYVSDGTGITAETIGHSLLTQFTGVSFDTRRIAFVDSLEKAEAAVEQIRRAGPRPDSARSSSTPWSTTRSTRGWRAAAR